MGAASADISASASQEREAPYALAGCFEFDPDRPHWEDQMDFDPKHAGIRI